MRWFVFLDEGMFCTFRQLTWIGLTQKPMRVSRDGMWSDIGDEAPTQGTVIAKLEKDFASRNHRTPSSLDAPS